MLVDNFQQVTSDPEREYHLASRLDRTISLIRDDPEEAVDEVADEVDEADTAGIDHPIFTAIEQLGEWHLQTSNIKNSSERDFNLLTTALSKLEEVFEDARRRGWDDVSIVAVKHRLREMLELGGWDSELEREIQRGVELLVGEDLLTSATRSHVFDLLDEIQNVSGPSERDVVIDLYTECADWAESFRKSGDLQAERDVLRRAIDLRERIGGSPHSEEQRLIESYEEDVERSDDHSRNAAILQSGLRECREFLSGERRDEWLRQLRVENRKGRENMGPVPSGVTPQDIQLDADRLVLHYRSLRMNYSREKTFEMFLQFDEFLTDYEEAVEDEVQQLNTNPLSVLLSQSFENSKGDIVHHNPGLFDVMEVFGEGDRGSPSSSSDSEDWTPRTFQRRTKKMNAVVGQVLRRLIERGDIRESDFHRVLDRIEYLDPHHEAFLTDAIIAFFEEDYTKALHVGMPQFEAILEDLLEIKGEGVNKSKNDGTVEPATLGGLFGIIREEVNDDLGAYLEYQYTDAAGMNLRNQLAHGQYPYSAASFEYSAVLFFDILRTLLRIENHYP